MNWFRAWSGKPTQTRQMPAVMPRGRPHLFGIGLSKTGTTSLHRALVQLGFRSAHFQRDEGVLSYMRGTGPLRILELATFDALHDTPICSLYQELDVLYPGSKFILTTRPEIPWLHSCRRHWEREDLSHRLLHVPDPAREWIRAVRSFVYQSPEFDERQFLSVYHKHHQSVRNYFSGRESDFLEMDLTAGEGWDKLCPFLGLPVPAAPFPWANRDFTGSELPGADQLWRHAIRHTYHLGGLEMAAVRQDEIAAHLLDTPRVDLALGCPTFARLEDHALLLDPDNHSHGGALDQLREMAAENWLQPATDWLVPPAAPPAAPPSLAWLCFITGNRSAALTSTLDAWKAHLTASSGSVPLRWLIADDTEDPGRDAEQRSLLRQWSRDSGIPLAYAGIREKLSWVQAMEREGLPGDVLRFALFGDGAGRYRCGANRTTALLALDGSLFSMLDDDAYPPLADTKTSNTPHLCLGLPENRFLRFFGAAAAAESACLESEAAFPQEVERLLGWDAGAWCGRISSRTCFDTTGCPETLLLRIKREGARVRSCHFGLRGDLGVADSSMRWTLPRPSVKLLLHSAHEYELSLHSRHAVYGFQNYGIGLGGFHGFSTSLDTRGPMPPFFPVHRGEDYTFGRMMAWVDPASFCGFLPYTLSHRPFHDRGRMPPLTETGLPYLEFQRLLSLWMEQGLTTDSPVPYDASLKPRALAALDDFDLRNSLTDCIRQLASLQCQAMERALECPIPDPTVRRELEGFRAMSEKTFREAHLRWPVEWQGQENPLPEIRRLLHLWGEWLALWPDVRRLQTEKPELSALLRKPLVC